MHILRVGFSFSFKFGLKWALKLYPKDIAKWDQNFMTHRSGPHAKPLPKFQPNWKCNYFIIITTNFQPYTLSEVFIKSRIGFCKWNFTSIQLSIFRGCTKIGKFYTYLFAGHLFSIYLFIKAIYLTQNSGLNMHIYTFWVLCIMYKLPKFSWNFPSHLTPLFPIYFPFTYLHQTEGKMVISLIFIIPIR